MQVSAILALTITAYAAALPVESITAAKVNLDDLRVTNFKAEHIPHTKMITLEFELMQSDPQSTIHNGTNCKGSKDVPSESHRLLGDDQTDLYAACDNELVFPPRLYIEDEAYVLQITFDNYPNAQTFTIGRHRFTDSQNGTVESPVGSGMQWETLVVPGGAINMSTQVVPYP